MAQITQFLQPPNPDGTQRQIAKIATSCIWSPTLREEEKQSEPACRSCKALRMPMFSRASMGEMKVGCIVE